MPPVEIQNSHDFDKSMSSPNRIMVIGVGGGGNNAVNHMFNQGIRNVTFVNSNTDRQDLNHSPVPIKVLLGNGKGAGNKPEVAAAAAEASAKDIAAVFNDDIDMVFIAAGMGGGTGTGASPIIARIAKEKGLLTIGIVTIPFLFEGEKKILKALKGADEMSKYVDALMVINNERLADIYSDLDFLNAFAKADDTLLTAAQSISEIINTKGYMNLDFQDVDTTLRDGGTAIISSGYGEGANRVSKAIQDALHSPLLKNTDIFGSKKLLFNLYYNPKAEESFKMEEMREINAFISNIDPQVDVIWGATHDESLGNRVKFTILAAGFDVTVYDKTGATFSTNKNQNETKATLQNTIAPENTPEDDDTKTRRLEEIYGKDKVRDLKAKGDEMRYIILKPDQLDDDTMIQALESTPTYNRDRTRGRNAAIANDAAENNNDNNTDNTPDPNIINFA